ncbi:VCBS repeat-containing protein [Oscillochloris sp. ZM17-4]|uniref:FG-GAP repeat domain-containing protein n=1 Tax=Oscillochloris sp. ZM17-4 TaxID=2866714 RepID=UPI001C734BEE|nr:VCBS repeat-containing protein [Oscillochloris sp. ZM17-4]MBX0331189.1 VCBS repeat-containing protein [Oscillochloris sp. ZM17-4]
MSHASGARHGRRRRYASLLGVIALLAAGLPAAALRLSAPAMAAAAPLNLGWLAPSAQASWATAWGDVDGDGDLDLALASKHGRTQIYRNCTVRSAADPCGASVGMSDGLIWQAPAIANTVALALVDVDGDGDLDLALANQGAASQIYRNCTVRSAAANPCGASVGMSDGLIWGADDAPNTSSMAWGDVDNSGSLDLVLGNDGAASQLYLNPGDGGLGAPITWQAGPFPQTKAVALGDVSGDGRLDLALGNSGTTGSQLFQNTCGPPPAGCTAAAAFALSGWAPAGADTTYALAFADLNSDSKLDLAVGNNGDSNKVFLNIGGPTILDNTAVFTATNNTGTTSLAWGDVDGDGDPDLAVGNFKSSSQLFRNNGGVLTQDPDWVPSSSLATRGVAWGDVDNNGSLDLALANESQPSLIYRNTLGTGFTDAPVSWGTPALDTRGVAWGDVDGDGDLDLAIAANAGSAVLRNTCDPNANGVCSGPGGFDPTPIWTDATLNATAVAWGDADNDGDLDLAVGATGQSTVFMNTCNPGASGVCAGAGGFAAAPIWQAPASVATTSLAWADVDGDGDLDLAVGNNGAPNAVYRNCHVKTGAQAGPCGASTSLSTTTILTAAAAADTFALAWGDIDGDGDPDLAIGNSGNAGQLYRNTNGALALDSAAWQATAGSQARSIAWGDVDGDGDLDLALGAEAQASQLYRNNGGTLTLDPGWQPEPTAARAIAWGDVDGDGNLDLVVANRNQPSQLYRNSGGALTLDPGWAPSANARGIALGDANRDGSLDIALGVFGAASQLYLNGLAGIGTPADTPAKVAVRQPGTPAGDLLSTARIIETTTISVPFSLADSQGTRAGVVRGFYSLDGGGTWLPAGSQRALAAPEGGQAYTFSWDTFASGFFGSSDSVLFRLEAAAAAAPGTGAAGVFTYTGQTAGSVPRASGGGTTMLFRARGTQIQVRLDGQPVAGATVYRLNPSQSRGGAALSDAEGKALTTNAQGFLVGRSAVGEGDLLAALAPAPAQPTDKRDVRLVYTSPIDVDTGRPSFTVVRGGANGLQILDAVSTRPLFLFDVPVYLEWDARNDPAFLGRLESDLQRASELLYDWSDGQAALGTLRLVADGSNPPEPGIHVYATNRLRPHADQGGVIKAITPDSEFPDRTYVPGSVVIGSVWSRYGGQSGAVGEDWARAMAHEFGHYALFLEDNYIGRDAQGQLISVTGCRGAMSDPYRDDYSEFHPRDAEWETACASTMSQKELQRADWETITRFYPQIATVPQRFNQHPGPSALRIAVTQLTNATSGASAALSTPIVSLNINGTTPYSYMPGSRARAFLFKQDGSKALDLGAPSRDQVIAYGAAEGDTLCAYDLTSSLVGCTVMSPSTSDLDLISRTGWNPDTTITPTGDKTITISVAAAGVVGVGPGQALEARVYPQSGMAAGLSLALSADMTKYQGTITLGSAFDNALVRIQTPTAIGAAPALVVVADYTRVGPSAGPALAGPGATCICGAPLLTSTDGQLLIYSNSTIGTDEYYSAQTAAQVPAPPPWGVVVGQAYRLVTNMDASALAAREVAVTIAYLDSELPAGTEGGLALYRWTEQDGWEPLEATHTDIDRNEIAASAVGAGIYALMARLDVHEGWNLISYPWPQAETIGAATARLNAAPGRQYTTIHDYDARDTADPWKVYDADVPAWVNDLGSLEYGRGYWFIVPPGGAPLQLNASLAAVPTPPATLYGTLPVHGAPAQVGLPVQAYSGSTLCGTSSTFTPAGVTQVAFRVEVKAAGQGAPEGCGIPGQPVSVVIGGVNIGSVPWDNSRPIRLFYMIYLPALFTPPA